MEIVQEPLQVCKYMKGNGAYHISLGEKDLFLNQKKPPSVPKSIWPRRCFALLYVVRLACLCETRHNIRPTWYLEPSVDWWFSTWGADSRKTANFWPGYVEIVYDSEQPKSNLVRRSRLSINVTTSGGFCQPGNSDSPCFPFKNQKYMLHTHGARTVIYMDGTNILPQGKSRQMFNCEFN